jgi:transcriptional regulator NrdR family protein
VSKRPSPRKCPSCHKLLVLEFYRDWKDSTRTRRYHCQACNVRYGTMESALAPTFSVAKKNGRVEYFIPEKLARNIEAIAHNHKMPKLWALEIALEVANEPSEDRTESTTGIVMKVARIMSSRDPGLAVRYLIATGDATFTDIATYHGWVRGWMQGTDR